MHPAITAREVRIIFGQSIEEIEALDRRYGASPPKPEAEVGDEIDRPALGDKVKVSWEERLGTIEEDQGATWYVPPIGHLSKSLLLESYGWNANGYWERVR